jgi:hypothetical protein
MTKKGPRWHGLRHYSTVNVWLSGGAKKLLEPFRMRRARSVHIDQDAFALTILQAGDALGFPIPESSIRHLEVVLQRLPQI